MYYEGTFQDHIIRWKIDSTYQPPERTEALLNYNPHLLQYVFDQTEEMCFAAIRKDAFLFRYIKHPTIEMMRLAVAQADWVIDEVKHQTEELCLVAVRANGRALRYVKKQTFEICLEACLQMKQIKYVRSHKIRNQLKLVLI